MEYIRCTIYDKTYKKGSAPCDLNGAKEGNHTCPKCGYYQTHLENLQQIRSVSLFKELGITARIRTSEELRIAELEQRNSLDGKPEIEYLYCLTSKTRNEFQNLLREHKEYDEERARSFICHIESDIGNFLKAKHDPARLDVQKIEEAIKVLEEAKEILLKLCSGRSKVLREPKYSYDLTFRDPKDPLPDDFQWHLEVDCKIRSETAIEPLTGVIKDLRSVVSMKKRKRSRPDADGDNLAFQIAGWFKEFIGRPRPQGGPFPKIIRKAFEICEIKHGKNCARAIRHALEKLYPPHSA